MLVPLAKYRVKSIQAGFSLLELVIVIALIGIMAISLSKLTSNSVYGYIDAKDRNRLSQSTKWVIERISRDLREAIPQSVRAGTSGNEHCVEFIPIVNSSTYFNIPATGSFSSFTAADFDLIASTASFVTIMPIDTASLYSTVGTVGSVASITSTGTPNEVLVTLSGPTNFSNRSPHRRFFLFDSPVSYCLDDTNGQMTRYSGYALSASQPFPPASGGQLVGENFSANTTVFNYQANTLARSGLLQINLHAQNRGRSLTGNQESFDVFHEVHIRNVP